MDESPETTSTVTSAPQWQALPQRARRVFMISGGLAVGAPSLAIGWVPMLATDLPGWAKLAMYITLVIACAMAGAMLGRRRWQHTSWRLDDTGLSVRRGRYFFSETHVPRSRVQHLDLERGPIERRQGLATLVVHTAGTRTHALRQPGLDENEAMALRDALLPKAGRNDDNL